MSHMNRIGCIRDAGAIKYVKCLERAREQHVASEASTGITCHGFANNVIYSIGEGRDDSNG